MEGKKLAIFFDRRDHVFLGMVNDVLARRTEREYSQRKFYPHLHPRGIKELAESRGPPYWVRGHSFARIPGGGPSGGAPGRSPIAPGRGAQRLRRLHAQKHRPGASPDHERFGSEVRGTTPGNWSWPTNSGRRRRASHPFYAGSLKKYHLLELPEEWNHLAFDDHVHDANTKGRKSATHLIMDAWIKGIRRLRVIYYNYIQPQFAAELLEAAEVMGLDVRIGIEFSAAFHHRFIQLIWVPRGFQDAQSFLAFLRQEPVRLLMEEGRAVSEYQQKQVLAVLDKFNRCHLEALNRRLGLNLGRFEPGGFP